MLRFDRLLEHVTDNVQLKCRSGAFPEVYASAEVQYERVRLMNIHDLKPGDKVRTVDGALVEVLKETEDGKWILVRYEEGTEDPAVVGTEDLCSEDELLEVVRT